MFEPSHGLERICKDIWLLGVFLMLSSWYWVPQHGHVLLVTVLDGLAVLCYIPLFIFSSWRIHTLKAELRELDSRFSLALEDTNKVKEKK